MRERVRTSTVRATWLVGALVLMAPSVVHAIDGTGSGRHGRQIKAYRHVEWESDTPLDRLEKAERQNRVRKTGNVTRKSDGTFAGGRGSADNKQVRGGNRLLPGMFVVERSTRGRGEGKRDDRRQVQRRRNGESTRGLQGTGGRSTRRVSTKTGLVVGKSLKVSGSSWSQLGRGGTGGKKR